MPVRSHGNYLNERFQLECNRCTFMSRPQNCYDQLVALNKDWTLISTEKVFCPRCRPPRKTERPTCWERIMGGDDV